MKNGQTGTVESVDRNLVEVKLHGDDAREVKIDVSRYSTSIMATPSRCTKPRARRWTGVSFWRVSTSIRT